MCVNLLQLCPTLCIPMDRSPPGSSVHRDSPGKNTGVGCHALLQGIFPTQRSNPCPVSPALASGFFTTSATWEAHRGSQFGAISYIPHRVLGNVWRQFYLSHLGGVSVPCVRLIKVWGDAKHPAMYNTGPYKKEIIQPKCS